MTTFRTGNHWGVTIVREGELPYRTVACRHTGTCDCASLPYRPDLYGKRVEGNELVAVVTNGDTVLAERIAHLLSTDGQLFEAIGLLGEARRLRRDGEDAISAWAKFEEMVDDFMRRRQGEAPSPAGSGWLAEAQAGADWDLGPIAMTTTQAISKHLRILGYSYPGVEWDGAMAAARAWTEREEARVRAFPQRPARANQADPLCVYPDGVCTCGEPEGHRGHPEAQGGAEPAAKVWHEAERRGSDSEGYGRCTGCGELWPCKGFRGEAI